MNKGMITYNYIQRYMILYVSEKKIFFVNLNSLDRISPKSILYSLKCSDEIMK